MTQFYTLALTALLSLFAIVTSTPIPDTSTECLSCKAFVNAMDIAWSNATTVDMILKELDIKCIQKYNDSVAELKVCQAIASVFVQIPPGLFEGMESLAWPIPEATCATILKCSVSCCGPLDPPSQVHLSLASTDRSIMGVSWATLESNFSIVEFSTNANLVGKQTRSGYFTSYISGGWVGHLHRATMDGLKESTTYYYRVGDGEHRWSQIFSFTTLTPNTDVTFGILADIDFESTTTMANMIDLVQKGAVQVVLINGDESYADGYEPHWDRFFERIEPMAARVPVMVTPGNHEFWYNFSGYKHRFFLPGVLDLGGSGDGMFYSMNVNYAHLVMGNSETAIDTANFSSSFMKWMGQDLSEVNRENTPAVMTFFHRPLYCSNDDACTTNGGAKLKKQAEEIIYDNKVNLVVTSHIHAYERMFPMHDENYTQKSYDLPYTAPTYIVMGASGNREDNKGPYHDLPEWSAFNDQSVGFVLMTVSKSAIDWSFYASHLPEDGGPVLKDHFVNPL